MKQIEEIFHRLSQVIDIKSNNKLADLFMVAEQTIRTWKNRDKIPYEQLVEVSKRNNISLNWLLTGEGEKYIKKKEIDEVQLQYEINDEQLELIIMFLREWWKKASRKEQIWLEIQLERYFPEYADWLEEKK
jgi:hypothetical protein